VHTLEGLGVVATCNPGGAGKWKPEFSNLFAGSASPVFIIPDMDGPAKHFVGERHGLAVADSLLAIGVEAKLLRAAQGKDATDHVTAGLGVGEFVALDRLALAQMTDAGDSADSDAKHLDRVRTMKDNERARAQAKAELASEGWEPPPFHGSLEKALITGVPDAEYTIEALMPRGANVLLNAQWKKGKTTAALNLARSLTDGTPVFGAYPVDLPIGGVAWWNAEMDDRTALRWLDEMAFAKADRVFPLGLRGYRVPLGAAVVRDWAVEWLRSNNVKVWILDPFGTLYDGEENSNSEVREWLKAVDEIKRRASVDNVILVAHTGHMGDDEAQVRARGAARLMDWADAIWSYRAGNDANPERRYLSAYGRDVNLPEVALDFGAPTRSLTVAAGAGSRSADRREALAVEAAEAVIEHHRATGEPMTKTALENALERGKASDKRAAISAAILAGWVRVESGGNRSLLHYPGNESPNHMRIKLAE